MRNPFQFGGLADASFADREQELRALTADMRNGQDVVLYAPRRYGKSSLVERASRRARRDGIRVGYVDLLRTPTKERFAAALAGTLYRDLESRSGEAVERAARLFRSLRITPTVELDPRDASFRFVFQGGRDRTDIDATIERLLELPQEISDRRKRPVVLVFDEFQEILTLDRQLPNLLRAIFQRQPGVAHLYLGSKRHILAEIFDDRNQPFWRSAKRMEMGVIDPSQFAPFLQERFETTEKSISDEAVQRLLAVTVGHPYATQELAHFLWESVSRGHFAHPRDVDAALEAVLRSEHNHFAWIWDELTAYQRLLLLGLAEEPAQAPYSEDYRRRHGLPSSASLQRVVAGLERQELVGRDASGALAIQEPFLAAWLRRGGL